MSFEVNRGQTDPRVSFLARGAGYTLFLTATGATLRLPIAQAQPARKHYNLTGSGLQAQEHTGQVGQSLPGVHIPTIPNDLGLLHQAPLPIVPERVVQLRYLGANPHPQVVGLDKLPGIVNYFIGNNPRTWRTNIPTYGRVAYRNVYPGIDLVYYGRQGQLEYDWIVAPGARPNAIQVAVQARRGVRLDARGNLIMGNGRALLQQSRPVA